MKLYTGQGDHGDTNLFDGSQVSKDDRRVAAYGQIDELNARLGSCRTLLEDHPLGPRIERIQRELFVIGGELATPHEAPQLAVIQKISPAEAQRLETWIDQACDAAPPLKSFILPGGSEQAARLHLARTGCREAERHIVTLMRHVPVRQEIIVYLNRLSDLLFAWARQMNAELGREDILWTSNP